MKHQYPSDVSRDVFEKKAQPLLLQARKRTKPRSVDLYDVFCGVSYVLKSGCPWRMLPSNFPKWRTCYEYFRQWSAKDEATDLSLLEEALKKCGWRGPTKPWSEREHNFSDR